MKIILAEHAGFCFGVNRAVNLAKESIETTDGNLYSHGPLIHNNSLVNKFKDEGLVPVDSIDEIEKGTVVTRSHGLSKSEIDKMKDKGLDVIDTTCPFVTAVHNRVAEFEKKGYNIIIVGKKDHPEVIGINGWCNNNATIIENVDQAKLYKGYKDVCIVSQTTNRLDFFNEIVDIIEKNNDNTLVFNTICDATSKRQDACMQVAKQVDAMVVIGGLHSSNTNKLAEVSRKHCKNVYHIETIKDLPLQEIAKFNTIGVTAGASTPDWIIKEAIQTMNNENNEMQNEMMEAIESSFTQINRGDVITGEVLFVTDTEVMVNIGYTSDGIIDKTELSNDPNVNPKDLYEQGDEIKVFVMRMDDGEGNVVLSAKRVEESKKWEELEAKYENGEKVMANVVRNVKGGLAVLVDDLNAFMPASHVSVDFVSDLAAYKGKELESKIIDFDKSKRRIIVSRKEVEKVELDAKKEKLWEELEEGQIVKGIVRRLTNFGAFVDLGGLDGLIHISDLAWFRVKHPSEIVSAEEEVEVKILGLDQERNRISLGLKQTTEKPWDIFVREVEEGDVVKGKVVNLLEFGAFIRLEQGVDGLLHVSQISNKHIDKPSDVLSMDQELEVKVINIDEEEQKISLSTREDELSEEVSDVEEVEEVEVTEVEETEENKED